jgi:biotin transport system substrate-specific component
MISSTEVRMNASQDVTTPSQTLSEKMLLVVAASILVAVCAHVSLPLPFTPIPLTLSDFAVVLVGLALGPVAGFMALALYLAEGAAGLPVFAPQGPVGIAHLLGPTAGYLLAYPVVAAVAGLAGKLARRGVPRFAAAIVSGTCANAILFTSGAAWLSHLHHLSSAAVLTLTVTPFLFGSAAKVVAAAGIFTTFRNRLRD